MTGTAPPRARSKKRAERARAIESGGCRSSLAALVGGAAAASAKSRSSSNQNSPQTTKPTKHKNQTKPNQTEAIAAVLAACVEGAKVVDLCRLGDDTVAREAAVVFKGKKIEKGVAFPTCVSPNSVVGHLSPATAEADVALKAGDVVKVDLGAHIDGYVATQAATRVVGGSASLDTPATGPAADVIAAARTAFDAAVRMMRPGKRVADVSDVLAKCVEPFGCTLVEGVMSHQIKRHVIDGNKAVLNRPTPEHRVDDAEFEQGEVYAVDVVVSTGEGHARVKDERETTVFKRAVDVEYRCKLKAARAVLHEVGKLSPTMLFTTRRLKEAAAAAAGGAGGGGKEEALTDAQLRMGLTECLTHGLLHAYPVLHEKAPTALVAQFKATVLLMPGGASDVITNWGGAVQAVDTAGKAVTDKEVLAVLAASLKPKKKKAKAGGGEAKAAVA